MDATTNFLTAQAPSPRGNDVIAGTGSGEISPSGAQFAGVLNGQMLKLERQALASSREQSADLQVLRLGNKLNVITTDAPLPDVASLADFARAQGLGESAVRALFGSGVSGLVSQNVSTSPLTAVAMAIGQAGTNDAFAINTTQTGMAISMGQALGSDSQAVNTAQAAMALAMGQASANESLTANSAQAAMALARASAKELLQAATTQDGMAAMASQSWINLRAQSAAAAAISLGADNTNPSAKAPQTSDQGSEQAAIATLSSQANADTLREPIGLPADTQSQLAALLIGQKPGPVSPKTSAGEVRESQAEQVDVAAALAAAVQAGLGRVSGQAGNAPGTSAVTVTSLSIEKSAVAQPAKLADMGPAILVAARALSTVVSASGAAPAQAQEEGIEPSPDMQIRLLPPDQAITRRLAEMTGKAQPMDWSALLAGQKVSDTLAGLAKGGTPALSDAQAAMVAQMQANGQLPASNDEARNALLAKLQAQASRLDQSAANAYKPAGAPTLPTTGTGLTQAASANAQNLMDNVGVMGANARALAPAALQPMPDNRQPLNLAHANSLWETVRIEVPSGLTLEALQARKALLSDAEPALPEPVAAPAGPSASANNGPVTTQAQAASPQALAEQRAAQYQQVADQLGEAMAKRLMAQIERGQWKMQMRMQPASLGRIDVQLDMHAKGLDATFTAENAVTRELMAQGSARLRDTLTQTGTTVASVVVNGDSGRQSGGNSTPGRKSKGDQDADNKKASAKPVAIATAMPPATQGDGLNVLA